MKHTKSLISFSAILCATLAVGCGASDSGSCNIKTSGIYADFEAVATGNGKTDVEAVLRTGDETNSDWLFLCGDDALSATVEGDKKGMYEDEKGDRHWHRADFETEAAVEVKIDFQRGDGDPNAPDSTVTMPEPYSLSFASIDIDDEVMRGSDIDIEWSNTTDGERMFWEVEGDCIRDASGTTGDDGDFTIPADEIEVRSIDEGETCEVRVTLERRTSGTVDSAYGQGGEFEGIQRRALTFASTPGEDEVDGTGMGGTTN